MLIYRVDLYRFESSKIYYLEGGAVFQEKSLTNLCVFNSEDRRAAIHRCRIAAVIPGYLKWFGVDKICAIHELKTLGVPISEDLEEQIKASLKLKKNKA